MLIGRQEDTGFGGRVDLLAIAPDGSLILVELKRNRTPREVVAQALDYASWVEKLRADEIAGIYKRFAPGRSLEADFKQRFGLDLKEDMLNQSHEIVIVAASLDDSSERIVNYLSQRSISINILCFQIFAIGSEQLLSRSWLLDPVKSQASSAAMATDSITEPWNGEFYCSFGEGESRSWADAVEYEFICAGGGEWYSRTLSALKPGRQDLGQDSGLGFCRGRPGDWKGNSGCLHSRYWITVERRSQCSTLLSAPATIASFSKIRRSASILFRCIGCRRCQPRKRFTKSGRVYSTAI